MIAKRNRAQIGRNASGSSISEFGPALGLLLICFFFPAVDMISLGVSYGCCQLLNQTQVHEASLLNWNQGTTAYTTVTQTIPNQWQTNGFGQFAKVAGTVDTSISFLTGQKGSDGVTDKIVAVHTTVTCNPFLPIPVPVLNVPGLNGPMTFTITAERPMENPDYGQ